MLGSLTNALFGRRSANRQTRALVDAQNRVIDENRRQYDQTRQDFMPWMDAGRNALARLQTPQQSFTTSPGYQWRVSEGQRDLGNSFAARGGAFSGNALRALTEFNQKMASNEFGNWWNQQSDLARMGFGGTASTASAGQAATNNIGNALSNIGTARASGIAARYQATSDGVGGVLRGLTQIFGV